MREKNFSQQRVFRYVLLVGATIIFILLLILGFILARFQGDFSQSVNCAELPMVTEVEDTLRDRVHLIEQIKQVNPGFVHVSVVRPERCPEKAYLILAYATTQDKVTIQELLEKLQEVDNKRFFGIPYFLRNV